MRLTEIQTFLLQQVADKPRVKSVALPLGCKELEAAGLITVSAVNIQDLLVEITEKGRQALLKHREDPEGID